MIFVLIWMIFINFDFFLLNLMIFNNFLLFLMFFYEF